MYCAFLGMAGAVLIFAIGVDVFSLPASFFEGGGAGGAEGWPGGGWTGCLKPGSADSEG